MGFLGVVLNPHDKASAVKFQSIIQPVVI